MILLMKIILPLVTVLLFLTIVGRAVAIWQKVNRTMFWELSFLMVYVSLFGICIVSAAKLPRVYYTVFTLIFVIALAVGDWYMWRDLFLSTRLREIASHEEHPNTIIVASKTLGDLIKERNEGQSPTVAVTIPDSDITEAHLRTVEMIDLSIGKKT